MLGHIPAQHLFAVIVVALLALFRWPTRWLISGAPLLTYSLLLGSARGYRVLSFAPLWSLLVLVNLAYSVVSTSWLLYWAYTLTCYPALLLVCICQFDSAARLVRRRLRWLLNGLQFTNDVVALFDLPALEIDVDVEGLMCIRGLTISLSSLTVTAYGVEVGIKLSDDLEIALVVDKVIVRLFRRIDISDVYGNVKGGLYEMTFGKLAKKTRDSDGHSLMVTDTSLLAAAANTGDMSRPGMPRMQTMTEQMTGGQTIEVASIRSGFDDMQQLPVDDEDAKKKVRSLLDWIDRTSVITTSRIDVEAILKDATVNDIRASICSQLHDKPAIPHPATKAIRVSTIKKLSSPAVRTFLHRLPLLLRCLLNPIAYFHPIFIESITVGGSGKFLQHMLDENLLSSNTGVKNLKQRISAWLADASFVFQMADVVGLASVPINTDYDIVNNLTIADAMAYRTLPAEVDLAQIIRLGGADARIAVPSFLLPHHEHLLPARPTQDEEQAMQEEVEETDGLPKRVQVQKDMEKRIRDEANVSLSAHVRLPACFDQSLLDFIAALVKATKIVEMEKDDPVEKEGVLAFAKGLGADIKDSMRRVAVDAAANDRWIAKIVGKVTKSLETMQGDVGYSGDIPVPLEPYRKQAETASKLMP
ncbi:hypothetical protein BDZ85DRAFT_202067 [Elsinoe ampelina]|uniref:Uncharacterized protein n=1 Tax=Elsinoe ampelina TaxID=302913 RepID=A0A6A6G7U6_9PEZI|nr:hypothetical protein BDZ85DRAFT_202067 [Elsinoe ampelina]